MPSVPGFPTGVWTASADDEGDASGGQITFQHIFRNTSNNLGDNQLYNIEHVMCHSQGVIRNFLAVRITGMDPGTGQVSTPEPIDRQYNLPLNLHDDGLSLLALDAREGTVPIWVGTFSGPDTDFGDVRMALDNEDSTRVQVALYGYYWAPAAVNAPGGIQRPPNGLWRA